MSGLRQGSKIRIRRRTHSALLAGLTRQNGHSIYFTPPALAALSGMTARRIINLTKGADERQAAVAEALRRMPEVYQQIIGPGGRPGLTVTREALLLAKEQARFCGFWPVC
ncbi:hypothetical protein GCM10009422_08160 [Brevundimonas kwangchunensis]|uniref:Uncharacterized protein n=2 Tax=Brevundimonas kwangchunensis TaxID=322163 RepID=A0ABN1GNZ5_9CAUL